MSKSKSKTYTTSEIAKRLDVSVSTVTRFAQKQKINPIAITQNNAKHYCIDDFEGLHKKSKTESKTDSRKKQPQNNTLIEQLDIRIGEKQAQIDELKNTIEILQKQLNVKDEQIATANRIADQAQQLDLTTHKQQKALPVKSNELTDNNLETHNWLWKLFH